MLRSAFIRTVVGATLLVAVSASGTTALAQGEISFNGSVNLFNSPIDPVNILRIDFLGGIVANRGLLTPVAGATGVFGGACGGTTGSVSDLDINVNGTTTLLSAQPFLTFGTCSFNSTSFTTPPMGPNSFGSVLLAQVGSNVSASIGLNGLLTGGGLPANTLFSGIFTTQFSNQTIAGLLAQVNANGVQDKSVSATFSYNLTSVPEPSSSILVAAGLAGLVIVARRRQRSA